MSDLAIERDIDHWAYFDTLESAETFADWAQQHDYSLRHPVEAQDDQFCVRLIHHGSVQLHAITATTAQLSAKADELGGDYDGWETPIMKEVTT